MGNLFSVNIINTYRFVKSVEKHAM
jgi:hypothetical protein